VIELVLEEGDELDRIIAERVFGLEVLGKETCTYIEGSWDVRPGADQEHWSCYVGEHYVYLSSCVCTDVNEEDAEILQDERCFGHYSLCCDVVPFYHEDMQAAMQIADEMPYFKLERLGGVWRAQVSYCKAWPFDHTIESHSLTDAQPPYYCGCAHESGSTPAAAIARAAVKWLRISAILAKDLLNDES